MHLIVAESERANLCLHDGNEALLGPRRSVFMRYVRPAFAELIGVAVFVFIGSMAAATHAADLSVALAHGLTIAVLITGLGHIR